MAKLTQAMLALGLVAGLGIAILPLSASAETDTYSRETDISIDVKTSIMLSLEALKGTEYANDFGYGCGSDPSSCNSALTLKPTDILNHAKSGLNAKVRTNNKEGYSLTLKTTDEEGRMKQKDGTEYIPTKNFAAQNIVSAWGYNLDGGDTFTAIPVSSAETGANVVAENNGEGRTNTDGTGESNPVYFGASVNPEQAEGQYTGRVIFTATAK